MLPSLPYFQVRLQTKRSCKMSYLLFLYFWQSRNHIKRYTSFAERWCRRGIFAVHYCCGVVRTAVVPPALDPTWFLSAESHPGFLPTVCIRSEGFLRSLSAAWKTQRTRYSIKPNCLLPKSLGSGTHESSTAWQREPAIYPESPRIFVRGANAISSACGIAIPPWLLSMRQQPPSHSTAVPPPPSLSRSCYINMRL